MNLGVKTILILAANPQGTSRLRLDEEVRESGIDVSARIDYQPKHNTYVAYLQHS